MSDLDVTETIHPGTAPGEDLVIEIKGDGDFDTAEMTLSIGPAHPATHGVLRIIMTMDGERITHAEPVIGYMHRGFEKLAEYRDYRQIMALTNRHDWLSGFNNELGVALAVEKMLEMEVPDRAQWIRMLLASGAGSSTTSCSSARTPSSWAPSRRCSTRSASVRTSSS